RSTQMYYAKMTIDKSALEDITGKLNFPVSDDKLNIEDVKITTECTQNDTSNKLCKCREGHRWSDEVCQKRLDQDTCVLPVTSVHTCILSSAVGITGELRMKDSTYQDCLTSKTSPGYRKCHDDLLELMKAFYSEIRGFDSLKIEGFRIGSIVTDFAMKIVSGNVSQRLFEQSTMLSKNLSAEMILETT
ncbi:PREDICTED: adhesion G protein-coupled receptor F5-like, partial [Cyprinodon variegatus]|uniref:adhesion G protein-coupled receptor F5-like n=1 Tax=Cyprinodon variegatus TaxID=28743 RepID=UPI0007428DCD